MHATNYCVSVTCSHLSPIGRMRTDFSAPATFSCDKRAFVIASGNCRRKRPRDLKISRKAMRKLIAATVLAMLGLAFERSVSAQPDPRQVLAGMIYQVSTGTENPSWYSPV